MKKFYYSLFAAASMMLAVTSCSQEEDFVQSSSEMTTFSISLDGATQSRTAGDGKTVDKLYYAVYSESTGEVVYPAGAQYGTANKEDGGWKLDLPLMKSETYDILFWAQKDGSGAYEFTNLKEITVKYDGVLSNKEDRDAFFNALDGFKASGSEHTIVLRRPFAQLNVATTIDDWTKAKTIYNSTNNTTGVNPVSKSAVTVSALATKFNVLTGEASVPTTGRVTFGANTLLDESIKIKRMVEGVEKDVEYKLLAMNYLLPEGTKKPNGLEQYNPEEGKENTEVEFTLYKGTDEQIVNVKVPATPIQRNWRTNIIGDLLTGEGFDVVIEEGFDNEENQEIEISADGIVKDADGIYHITTTEGLWNLARLVNNGSQSASTGGRAATVGYTFVGKTFVLDGDIDLQGDEWTPIGNGSTSFNGTFDGNDKIVSNFKVTEKDGYVGLFGRVHVGEVKNVKVKDVTLKAHHYAGGIVGQGYVKIENCHAENVTITLSIDTEANDFGDKAGGIIGQNCEGASFYVKNCTAKNVNITGYRDLGGIVGMAQYGNTVSGNTVEAITIVKDFTNGYQTEQPTTFGAVIGRRGVDGDATVTESSNSADGAATFVEISGEEYPGYYKDANGNYCVTANEGIAAAITDGATEMTIKAGEYTALSDITSAVTINCEEGTVFKGKSSLDVKGSTVIGATFSNNSDAGAAGNINGTFKNCTFTGNNEGGVRWSYTNNGDVTFENCTFGDDTHLRSFHVDSGSGSITFKGCTLYGFTALGSSLPLVKFEDCQFKYSSYSNGSWNVVNMYKKYEFVNCEFDPSMHTDCAGDGVIATFTGCSYTDGSNLKSIVRFDGDSSTCTITIDGLTYVADNLWKNQNGEYVADTADALAAIFKNIKAGDKISIVEDIDMTGKSLDATNGNVGFTLNGNGKTISNLKGTEAGLFVNNTGSADYYFYNVKLQGCSVESSTNYGALFVGDADTCDELVIEGCEVNNCTVKSAKYAAAFVGYTAGWNVQNDGPVYSDVTIKNCKVVGGSIEGGGSTATAIGHAGGNVDTTNKIENLNVSGVAINGEDAAHTGIVVGTANVGKTYIYDATYDNVTGNYNTEHPLFGRFVPGETGELKIFENGEIIFPRVFIGEKGYATLDAALTAAVEGDEIKVKAGEYHPTKGGGKKITISAIQNEKVVFKLLNQGEDGCDYGFGGNGTGVGTYVFNNITFDTTENTGNYKGYAYMGATYNNCNFVGAWSLNNANDFYFNNCTFDFKNGYFWTWGANNVSFDECTFNGNSKTILAHGWASTKIIINDCTFAATEKGFTGSGDNTACIEIDPAGTNTYTINFTGEKNTKTDSYAGWTRIKDGSTGHTITGVE